MHAIIAPLGLLNKFSKYRYKEYLLSMMYSLINKIKKYD